MGSMTAEGAAAYPRFAARLEHGPDVATVLLVGELDMAVEDETRATIDAAWRVGAQAVVIDLTAVTFMDSTGVQALLAEQSAADAAGRPLALRLGPPAQRVLELCGILPRFTVVA
jgi:anti-anti-sigma factor